MALLKVVNEKYLTMDDVFKLFNYFLYKDKNPYYTTNLFRTSNTTLDGLVAQWMFAHRMYQPDSKRTLAYQYVLSFDMTSNIEYNALRDKGNMIFRDICSIPAFQGLLYFACEHRRDDGVPEHIHIAIDSIHSDTGHSTYIKWDELKREIGEVLALYGIALAGYSYERRGRIYYGNLSPADLYEENLW